MILSPLHPLALQDSLGAWWSAQSSLSTGYFPINFPDCLSLQETPSEGIILEIQVFFCIPFTQMLRECQEVWRELIPHFKSHAALSPDDQT